jgi:hypothetical protein
MRVAMDTAKLGGCGGARRLNDAPSLLPCCRDPGHDLPALDALGMSRRRLMLEEAVGMNEDK